MTVLAIDERTVAIDGLLFEICESLQLSETQHSKAEKRYKAIAAVIDGATSPFVNIESNLYPQGSMRLGTTVKPLEGPHDLDFVCEFAVSHRLVKPMALLDEMFNLFHGHGVYGGMVTKKNRCVRIEYKDEFYLDVLPACVDQGNGGGCIQVPDRQLEDWSPSNPREYALWFEASTQQVKVQFAESGTRRGAMDSAASVQPVPSLQATEDKTVLQLVVQLMKRWRDIHYSDHSFPPISIVLTTLAARSYQGEEQLSEALLNVLERIIRLLDTAHAAGRRLEVRNPSHPEEDFSERWDNNLRAYQAFNAGIRDFARVWRVVCTKSGSPNAALEELFGETVVNSALIKQAKGLHTLRTEQKLGIRSSGLIVPVSSAVTAMLPNTNHGER